MATDATRVPLADPAADNEDAMASREAWEAAAAGVLRKAKRLGEDAPDSDVWAELATQTLDGISKTPLGTSRSVEAVANPGLPGQAPYTRGAEAVRELQAWDIRSHFIDPDAKITTEHVMADLENGVNSLWLSLGEGAIALDALPGILDRVFCNLAPIVIDAPHEPAAAARAFAAVIKDKDIRVDPRSNLGADPLGNSYRGHGETDTGIVEEVARIATEMGCRAITVDGTAVHDSGASDVQELAYTLAAGATYLRLLVTAGHDVDTAANLLEFRFAASDEQFPTIAKFRAARRLWHRVTELSGVAEESRAQLQHAVTSRPMMSKYDPYVNMLRTTVAAFAAGVGGAQSVTVLPFDTVLGLPESFSRRIARNTSSLLIAESHVAAVTDPAGGAYAVEELTENIAHAAWRLFGEIEESGRLEAVISDGSFAARVEETATRRSAQIARRERPLTGVSEYPNLAEELPERRPYAGGTVPARRYGAAFEAMRDEPTGARVFLATMGTVAAHTARASFVINLLAAGGIATTNAGRTDDMDDVIAAYDGSAVVCLAGNDTAYEQWGREVMDALRSAGAKWVILAGKSDLPVDDQAVMGLDALEFLQRTRAQLNKHPMGAQK